MKLALVLAVILAWAGVGSLRAGNFPGAPGSANSTAIRFDDPRFIAWGTAVADVNRGLIDIRNPDSPLADYGDPGDALGSADAFDPAVGVVSLGDAGWITITFDQPIGNGLGFDFAVFENGFDDRFLELAFVEVAGPDRVFVRFPSTSLTQTATQIDQASASFTGIDPTDIDGLAGKYRALYGTPFDLSVVGLSQAVAVRIVDVVGSINAAYGTHDSDNRLINDPFPTVFNSGGFDLDAIGVLHTVPEPGCAASLAAALLVMLRRPRRGASRRSHHAQAFTLIELLVTIAIIALLATLTLAAINAARTHGDSAKCMNNLRELSAAALTYVSENNGQYVAAQEPSNRVRWHGVRGSATGAFDPTKGPLAPFLGHNGRVKLCPALVRVLKGQQSFEDGTGGYGYNAAYIGGTPGSSFKPEFLANVPSPVRVVMFADCAFPRAAGLQEYAFAEPWQWADATGRLSGALSPSVHFRHGGKANVAWCDGHITAEEPTKLGAKNSYGGDASKWEIGWFGPSDNNGWWNPQRTTR